MKVFKIHLNSGGYFYAYASSYSQELGQGYTVLIFFGNSPGEILLTINKNLVGYVEEENNTLEKQ